MMNKFLKLFKQNLILIVPSLVVLLMLVGFLIFGFQRPVSSDVYEEADIITAQLDLQYEFFTEFEEGNYTIDDPFVILNPFEVAPLSALVMFESVESKQYEVIVRGRESNGDMVFLTPVGKSHYVPIYGLYENNQNVVEFYEYIDDERGELVHTEIIVTDVLPEEVTRPTEVNTTYEYFGNDLMLVIPALNSYPMGIDYNGDIRFVLLKNLTFAPTILDNGNLLLGTDRLIVDPYYVTGLYEVDFLGKVHKSYQVPGGYHHDVEILPSGNFLILTNDFDGTVEDKIVEMDRSTGEIVDSIDMQTLIPELHGPSEMWTAFDWFHNNSIDYNAATDEILLSGRHQDIVVSISRASKEVNYIIGDPDNWPQDIVDEYFLSPIGEDFEWQYAQHDASFLPNGDIILFDNGNNKSKDASTYVDASESYSRLVHYRVDDVNMTIEQIYQFGKEVGAEFYSPYISNVDYYGEGHYMIHSGGHATVGGEVLNIPGPLYEGEGNVTYRSMTYEVQDGEIKYYLEIADNYYQAQRIQLYSGIKNFKLAQGVTFGELAETDLYEGEIDTRFSLFDTVPELYGITLVKEEDRLKIEGEFDADDVIYLRLVDEDEQERFYYIPTSSTDYTAMCTVTLREDQRFVTYYINETNIEGYYHIYFIINGREYNSYQHVTFN